MGGIYGLPRYRWVRPLAIVFSVLILGIAWSVSSPLGSSPDDDFHLTSIWCGTFGESSMCEPEPSGSDAGDVRFVRVPHVMAYGMYCYINNPQMSAACINMFADDDLQQSRTNSGLYPSGFYTFMSMFASTKINLSLLVMRLVSFLLCIGLIAASAALAPRALRTSFLYSTLIVSVPMALSLYASNNPSGVVIASTAAFWCAGHSMITSTSKFRILGSGLVGLVAALVATFSRADGAVFIGLAAVSVLLFRISELKTLWSELRDRTRRVILGGGAVALGLGIWLTTMTLGGIPRLGEGSNYSLANLLWPNLIDIPLLWSGALGNGWALGWDVMTPDAVPFIMMIILGGLIFQGVANMSKSKSKSMSVVFGVLCAIGVPMVLLINSGVLMSDRLVQPRYVLPILICLVATILLPAETSDMTDYRPAFPTAVILLVSVAHSLSLHATLRRYVTGTNRIGLDLNSGIEWWWGTSISPLLVWALGSLAFAALVVLVLLPIRTPVTFQRSSQSSLHTRT